MPFRVLWGVLFPNEQTAWRCVILAESEQEIIKTTYTSNLQSHYVSNPEENVKNMHLISNKMKVLCIY